MLPPDPRVEHKQDPLQRQAIVERLATRIAKTTLLFGQERLGPPPQRVRDLPRLRPHRHPPPTLTTGADGLRYRRTGPFIQLEVLSADRDRADRPLPKRRPARPPRRRRPARSELRPRATPPPRPRGNRQLNAALYRIAITQARYHPAARTYLERKQSEGKSRREAIRCSNANSPASSSTPSKQAPP